MYMATRKNLEVLGDTYELFMIFQHGQKSRGGI
jgi:hypothetical protein